MIAIVDSGLANLASVQGALDRLGAAATVTADPAIIQKASHVILPGVGAAATAMAGLKAKGLTDVLRGLTQPVLGICLGMQILFESSAEGDGAHCLGILPGTVDLLPGGAGAPIPHMGWNQIDILQTDHPLLRGCTTGAYVYFVHSYAAAVSDMTVASTTYGTPFSAMVARGNFMGCQFHPERSGDFGSRILANFLAL